MSGHSSQNAQCANGKVSWGGETKYGEKKSSYVILCGAKPPGGSVQNWECKVTAFNCAVQSLHLGILEPLKCQMILIYINSLSYFRKLHPLFYKMDLCGIKCPFLIDSSQVAKYTWAFFILLSGKSFSYDKNKAETLLQDFSLFCYIACWKKTLVTWAKVHISGQPVCSQVIKLLDKAQIQQISLETLGSERYVKRLTGWKHLIIMLFGVLKHFDSLRDFISHKSYQPCSKTKV